MLCCLANESPAGLSYILTLVAYQLFEEEGRSMTRWYARMQKTGLWTFQSLKSSKYLCRDFVLRTEQEDTGNLRFWGLNPIVSTGAKSWVSLANLLIRKS